MTKIILKTYLIGHFLLISTSVHALNEHAPRFSINIGNMMTLSLSPSKTFGAINAVTLKPHPSNSKQYDEIAQLSHQSMETENIAIDSQEQITSVELDKSSKNCTDSEFGVEFYCESSWKWSRVDNAVLIIISNKPMVTMTITRINSPIKFLGQITDSYLKERTLYANGFQSEKVNFLGGEAVHVKAISHKFNDIRLSDYFFIRNNALYGVLFSVHPKEEWDNYKFTIQKIVQSLKKLLL